MKYLLIYPPSDSYFIRTLRSSMGLSPPLGLLYLAQILENNGDTVSVLDFSAEPCSEQKLCSRIQSVDAVGITVCSPSLPQVKHLIQMIKQKDTALPIIIGGPHCTLLGKTALEECNADISVQGDGELVIKDVIHALQSKKKLAEIPGIAYRTTDAVKQTAPAQLSQDLNTIPFPARHLVKHYVYGREYNPRLKAGEFTSILTSRGCPFTCRFCSRGSVSMRRFRTRTTENILSELGELQAQGYRHVAFADDCFPVQKEHAHDLFDGIIREQLNMTFSVMATRVDLADANLYEKMKRAGVSLLQFGLESGNQDVLDYYHKHTTVDMIRNAVQMSHKTGFFTTGSFIFGAPFETTQHFRKTLALAQSLPLDSVSFLPLRYMVGSDLWYQAVNENKIQKDEYLVLADATKGLGMYSRDELLRYCMQAQRSFYARPSFYINLLKTSLRNNNMTFIQAYISVLRSSVREQVHSDVAP